MSRPRNVTISAPQAVITFSTYVLTSTLIHSSLVRFRVGYNGKAPEGEDFPGSETPPKSYLGTIVGIYRHEGVSGLFKGIVPITLSAFAVSSAAYLDMYYFRPHMDTHRWDIAYMSLAANLGYIIAYPVIALPMAVVTNRDIVRPIHGPNAYPATSFRLPLTPEERRRPWLLYSIPGLFMTHLVTAGLVAVERSFFLRVFPEKSDNSLSVCFWQAIPRMALYYAIFTPLSVVATRLAVQRDHKLAESEKSSLDGVATERTVAQPGGLNNSVGSSSYTGMVDCARRIIKEEGFRALYRGWWVPV